MKKLLMLSVLVALCMFAAPVLAQDYGVMSGTKWLDMNGNHLRDSGEPGLSGWKIHFFKVNDPVPVEVITGPDGSYTNDMVEFGAQYAVCEVLEPTWVQTYPNVTLPADGYVDCTQFGPGYGPIGYNITLSGGSAVDKDFGNWVPTVVGCSYTWGYWKNHNKYQNAKGAHRDPGWDNIGEDTQFYGNWADPPTNSNQLTWFEILLIPPKVGNAYLILAHQYVAAWLNIHNGADGSSLGTTMADAEALLAHYSNNNPSFATYPPAIPKGAVHFTSDDRFWAVELAFVLDQFNNGYIGPGSCE